MLTALIFAKGGNYCLKFIDYLVNFFKLITKIQVQIYPIECWSPFLFRLGCHLSVSFEIWSCLDIEFFYLLFPFSCL